MRLRLLLLPLLLLLLGVGCASVRDGGVAVCADDGVRAQRTRSERHVSGRQVLWQGVEVRVVVDAGAGHAWSAAAPRMIREWFTAHRSTSTPMPLTREPTTTVPSNSPPVAFRSPSARCWPRGGR